MASTRKSVLDTENNKPRWSLKDLRFIKNPRYGESVWITRKSPIREIVNAMRLTYSDGTCVKEGDDPNITDGLSVNMALDMTLNGTALKDFRFLYDDRTYKISVSSYLTLSRFAKYHKIRINKKKMKVENVR